VVEFLLGRLENGYEIDIGLNILCFRKHLFVLNPLLGTSVASPILSSTDQGSTPP
jgi:hypothetical protein